VHNFACTTRHARHGHGTRFPFWLHIPNLWPDKCRQLLWTLLICKASLKYYRTIWRHVRKYTNACSCCFVLWLTKKLRVFEGWLRARQPPLSKQENLWRSPISFCQCNNTFALPKSNAYKTILFLYMSNGKS